MPAALKWIWPFLITIAEPLLALMLAPLLFGIINRTKAFFAGRRGQPLLQAYYDIDKLLRKGAVYSRTTSWVFRAGPLVSLAAIILAATIVPLAGNRALLSFQGDLLLFLYLLGLGRFFTVLAALDTGSAFEGMGASREVQFAALIEPAFILSLAAIASASSSLSLSDMFASVDSAAWLKSGPALAMAAAALFVVLLVENCRIPFDDPNTHLELTMIHEVMILDHSGPDLAFILYGAAVKFWLISALLVGLIVPLRSSEVPLWISLSAAVGGQIILAVVVGIVESTMARLRLLRVPQLLVGAVVLSVLALLILLR